MMKMMLTLKEAIKYHKKLPGLIVILAGLLLMPAIALSWPTNHLDSSQTGNKPYCISCHGYKTGYLTIEKINGITPRTSSVTVNRDSSFTVDFKTVGLGYGRFTAAGAVQVPDTSKWLVDKKDLSADVPWFVATQDTSWNAPINSPYVWATAFPDAGNPNAQKGVTLDDGTVAGAFTDRNQTAHDEQFTAKVTVDGSVPYGSYNIKLWGIGTSSNGMWGYNEKTVTVNVYDDNTSPVLPGSENLSTSDITGSAVTISWNAATDNQAGDSGINGYEIYRSEDSGATFRYVGYSYTNSYSDTELNAAANYEYKINAVDNAGNSTFYTTTVAAETLGSRTDATTPATPTGLSAFLITNPEDPNGKIVKLTWNANTEGDVQGYKVYRATAAAGPYAAMSEALTTEVEKYTIDAVNDIEAWSYYYIDTEIRYGTTYFYKVSAVDVAGKESTLTTYTSATPAVDIGDSDNPNGPHGNYKNKEGMCQNCHSMHSARGQELIYYSTITHSCYTCHDGSQSKYNTKAAFDPVYNPSHHKIPEGRYSCDACHNPHYSPEYEPEVDNTVYAQRLLATISKEDGEIKRGGNEFCWACHGVNSDLPNPFGRDHQTAFMESKHNSELPSSQITHITCRNCHVPHGSKDYPLMISANSANLCISCHEDNGFTQTQPRLDNPDYPDEPDTVISGVYLNNQSNDYLGTIHEKNFYGRNTCTMCHEPHGNLNNRYMLRESYNDFFSITETVYGIDYGPVDWITDWSQEDDTICFRCHDSRYYVAFNGDSEPIEPVIGSRFGAGNAKNYHSHVAELQVSCRACHDPHSGESMFQDTSDADDTYDWNLNNSHYINFDWAIQVDVATYSSNKDRLAFIPSYGSAGEEVGFSCAISCHQYDHWITGDTYKSYVRTKDMPPLKCAACHDYDDFDTNSRHPVLEAGPESGYKVNCEQCHYEDHTMHTLKNPYGLKSTIVSLDDWTGEPEETSLPLVINPNTGEEVPAYKEFCWQCHGADSELPGIPVTRKIVSDQRTYFINKPHSLLEREGTDNPYGPDMDIACLKCHENHASSNVRLLRNTIDGVAIDAATDIGKINACMACHDGSPAEADISAKYNAATSGGHFIKANPNKKLLCTECHEAHGTTSKKYLLDTDNKYDTGITFPQSYTDPGASREFCLACHPPGEEGQTARVYNTVYTLKVGEVLIAPLPYPERITDHQAEGRECIICHDPHKPWPATGGEDGCYDCHSRPNGEATDIKSLAGLVSQPGSGKVSHHNITDGTTADNTCMQRCHLAHPHDDRADHLKLPEKLLCLNCHDHDSVSPDKSPYTIDSHLFDGKPHDYEYLVRTYPADNSDLLGNCDKCHVPHGSDYKPLLRLPKDDLCVSCHNGVTTNSMGDPIEDIKTLYEKTGHKYTNSLTAKMYCDECHVPHGSTNDFYLRDDNNYAPQQTLTYVGETVYQVEFPQNMKSITFSYEPRKFCTTCHREYVGDSVDSWVYYTSETTPGGQVNIPSIPLIGDNGVTINEHKAGETKSCTDCHNPHDPEPVGSDKDCFICHGDDGYAYNIQELTGLEISGEQTWPEGKTAKTSFHPITDPNTQYEEGNDTGNDCMVMCHKEHVHNPRANVLKDKRSTAGDVTAPEMPTDFEAAGSSSIQVDLSWTASTSPDVFGYYIYRKAGTGDWSRYGVVNSRVYAPAKVWFYDGGLKPNTTYSYKVSAHDRTGNESGQTVAQTVSPVISDDKQVPSIPTNLKVTVPGEGTTRLTLSWTASIDNCKIVQYRVYRADSLSGEYTLIGSTGNTAFTDSGLKPESRYYYRVSAEDFNDNLSEWCAPVSGITQAAYAAVGAGNYVEADTSTTWMKLYDQTKTAITSSFPLGKTVYVQVYCDETGLPDAPDTAVVRIRNHLNTILAEYTSYSHPDGKADLFEWPVLIKSEWYSGVYVLEVELTHGGTTYVNTHEAIIAGATGKGFKFYRDSAYTEQAYVFAPGDTVYVKATSDSIDAAFSSFNVWVKDFKGNIKVGPFNPADEQYGFGSLRFSFVLDDQWNLRDNWWYTVDIYAEYLLGRARPKLTKIADYGAMFLGRSKDETAPGAPSSLMAANAAAPYTHEKMQLSWNASTGEPISYSVFRWSTRDSRFLIAGSSLAPGTTFTDTGLKPETAYSYQVKAVDRYGNISAATDSSPAWVTTGAEPADATRPNAPTGFRAQRESSSQVTTYWKNINDTTDGVVGYAVYRSRNGSDWLRVGVSYTKQYTDTGLRGNTLYYYYATAFDKAGNHSVPSAEFAVTTLRSGEDSKEGALCMSCHESGSSNPIYTVTHTIGSAYVYSKHNVDYAIMTFKDGSIYEGNCTKCHVPHGSAYEHLLKGSDDNNLCYSCHTAASNTGKFSGRAYFDPSAHGQTTAAGANSNTPGYWPGGDGVPARTTADAGRCYNCHAPHGRFDPETGQYIKSSAWRGTGENLNDLCYTCHEVDPYGEYGGKTVYEETSHGDTGVNAKMKFDGYGPGECTNCHEPHGSQYPGMLRFPVNDVTKPNQLCLECHDRDDILLDTGLFDGSAVYVNSSHGLKAQWFEELNTAAGVVYNKTSFLPGVCLNCHNSHGREDAAGETIPKMLVVDDGENNEICNKCHEYPTISSVTVGYPGIDQFSGGVHKEKALWPGGEHYTEATPAEKQGKCINCHDPHGTAEVDAWGRVTNITGNTFDWEEDLCYECHDGTTTGADMKFWPEQGIGHLPGYTLGKHSFNEVMDNSLVTRTRHVECLDCHNVHTVLDIAGTDALTTRLSKAFKGVSGVELTSMPGIPNPNTNPEYWTDPAKNPYVVAGYGWDEVPDVSVKDSRLQEYMVCFKCHSDYTVASTGGRRVIGYFNANNPSNHGFSTTVKNSFANARIEANGATTLSGSGTPGWAFNPSNPDHRHNITCSDCHGNSQQLGGPRGPHGSNYDFMLRADPRSTTFCTQCHAQSVYGSDSSAGSGTGTGSSGSHARANHYTANPVSGQNFTLSDEAVDAFGALYGNNWCRYCHFGGITQSSNRYMSVHGANGKFTDNRGDYRTYKGMNGFFISYTSPSTCYTTGNTTTEPFACAHTTGKGY